MLRLIISMQPRASPRRSFCGAPWRRIPFRRPSAIGVTAVIHGVFVAYETRQARRTALYPDCAGLQPVHIKGDALTLFTRGKRLQFRELPRLGTIARINRKIEKPTRLRHADNAVYL